MPPATLVALEDVRVTYGTRALLDHVTVGVVENARIGVVGRNGGGKTTLLRVLAADVPGETGRVVRAGGVTVAMLAQDDVLPAGATLREVVVGDRPEHDWASDARVRDVLDGLLGGVTASAYREGLATTIATMSGGERRRAALAALLVADADLLLLDEPTNHLDVEAVDWLARHLAARRGAHVVVTHDRWFLDAACTETWEVVDGAVHRYDGGYAAFVLARAERERTTALASEKRDNLLRKELAWLRRGAPARTSKPRFRIDAAEALIADEPPPRDRLELERFATARLGRQVYDLEHVSIAPGVGAPEVLHDQTWRLGPGDRIGLLGPNGAGKTTLLRLLAAGRDADHRSEHVDTHGVEVRQGQVEVGRTVVVGHLAQIVEPVDPDDRVLPSVSRVKTSVEVGRGRTLTALSLLEGFGFTGDRLQARLGDLSGGESRRLALLMLLLEGPNVLLLDEPTNDLDVETLTVVEDLLDGWPGTVVVVSHDRYFLERTTDAVYAMLGDGRLRHLPGGVEEYLRRRADTAVAPAVSGTSGAGAADAAPPSPVPGAATPTISAAQAREARKELGRLERRLEKIAAEEAALHDDMAAHATDHERVRELDAGLRALAAERDDLEARWLDLAAALES